MWSWTFGFHKIQGISWLVEDLFGSQEQLCSIDLVKFTIHTKQKTQSTVLSSYLLSETQCIILTDLCLCFCMFLLPTVQKPRKYTIPLDKVLHITNLIQINQKKSCCHFVRFDSSRWKLVLQVTDSLPQKYLSILRTNQQLHWMLQTVASKILVKIWHCSHSLLLK